MCGEELPTREEGARFAEGKPSIRVGFVFVLGRVLECLQSKSESHPAV